MLFIWVAQDGVVRMITLVFCVLTGGPRSQSGITGDGSRVVIYTAITRITLQRAAATAKSGWEKRRYVSIWGGGHGEAEMRGREVTASGRNRGGSSVKAFAVVATICTPIGM